MAGTRRALADAILDAPVGVCLLADLERAGRAIRSMSFGELATAAVWAGYMSAGPWTSEAPETIAEAYRGAKARAGLAEAIATRFAADLEAPIDLGRQELWLSGPRDDDRLPEAAFRDLDEAYDAGEFPHGGLWAANGPPVEAQDDLSGAWELDIAPLTRWHLPVVGTPRVLELGRPSDWVELVERHPKAARDHGSWSLPTGPNHDVHQLRRLEEATQGRAARSAVSAHLVPDWASVAEEWDAVHLTWAGFLTSEALVSDLSGGGVAMLRFWLGERVLWLRDRFGDPEPMAGPVLGEHSPDLRRSVDVRTDRERRARDRRWIAATLGR